MSPSRFSSGSKCAFRPRNLILFLSLLAFGFASGLLFQSGAYATGRSVSRVATDAQRNHAGRTQNLAETPGLTAAADATPIYAQPDDGRAVEGPSSKIQGGQQFDREVADDFELHASITRVKVRGARGGYNMPPNPTYYGVYVRFYDGAQGTPGTLQAEHFLAQGAPGVVFDAARPSTFDITLPSPFNADGRYFLSVQPVFGGSETWTVMSASYPNVRGSAWVKRDRLANGAWTVAGAAGNSNDMSFDLFGTLLSAPRIGTLSPNPVPRSGLVRISGAYFGAAQGSGGLTIDGRQSQYIAHWSDNLIVAYVPEASTLGDVPVRITTAAGTGSATLGVTTRPTDGRIRWRFTVAGDYVLHRSGIGPDGTIYLNDVNGRLYALSPDGGLKWVFRAGKVGYVGPVTVGTDGTVYVAGLVPKNPATACQLGDNIVDVDGVFAVNPDGTQKWLFDKTCQGIIAGPNVGPDGKIYAVSDTLGIGAFALNPDGTLAYAVDRFGEHGPLGEEIVFGPAAPGLAPSQQYFQFDNGSLFGYTLQGRRVFSYPTVTTGQPAAGLRTGSVYTVGFPVGAGFRLFSLTPQGAVRWQAPIQPVSGLSAPDAPPGETSVYVVQDQYRLHRVNPADGSVVWTFTDGEILFAPVASP
ncbi:MAG TPA: PQQ-binding-like beta-propeller repeat protein, partial [Pyrinomonadaceae bacterium]